MSYESDYHQYLDEVLLKAEEADADEDEEEEDEYPEIWFIFDGVGTYLGQVAKMPQEIFMLKSLKMNVTNILMRCLRFYVRWDQRGKNYHIVR